MDAEGFLDFGGEGDETPPPQRFERLFQRIAVRNEQEMEKLEEPLRSLVRLVRQQKWIEAKECILLHPQAIHGITTLFTGMSVMHMACSEVTDVEELIEAARVQEFNQDDETEDWLETLRQIYDFVQSLFDVAFSCDDFLVRSMLFCRDDEGDTPLQSHVRYNWSAANPALVKILLESAGKVSPTTPYELVTTACENGLLHIVSEEELPYQIFELLMACWRLMLEQGFGGLVHENDEGLFPIDRVVQVAHRFERPGEYICEIVDLMLRAHFGKIEAASEDWFPLHALAQAPFCRPYVLKVLLETYDWRNQLLTFDRQGMLPLHKAAAQPIPELLLRANQTPLTSKEVSALQAPSAQKALEELRYYPNEPIPSLNGMEMTEGENNMILLFLNALFEAAAIPARPKAVAIKARAKKAKTGGRLALHYAIESGHVWEVVRQLWKAAPDSVSTSDPKTGLFPFLLAASAPENPSSSFERKSNGGLDVIFELVCITQAHFSLSRFGN